MKASFDIAVIGSGFAGSLVALIARRLGHSVVLLERDRHPRFAIGESSTPLANLLLEELAQRYDLPTIAPLTKWGSWQANHPDIACGLKRGFTFYHHSRGQPWEERPDRSNQLLVAASPNDTIADTHWYRPDFDHFLVREAQRAGVEYLDEADLSGARPEAGGMTLSGTRHGQPREIRARFVVDASGPRGFLHHRLGLGEATFRNLPPTEALFTHFTGVHRWDAQHPSADPPPYPVDDAAVHHVFDGGWMWVLRFNNRITSAGVAATTAVARQLQLSEGGIAWRRLLEQLPAVGGQFIDARPACPFVHVPRLSFRSETVAGQNWVLLPSAAGFVDPLLSNGFPLTLLGIGRIAQALEEHGATDRLAKQLVGYERQTLRELDITADLVGALYANMGDPEIFSALTLLYFAAAMMAETRRRLGLGRTESFPSFLLEDDRAFGPGLHECLKAGRSPLNRKDRAALIDTIRQTIEPFNLARLGDPALRNWYPCLADDLFNAAPKLGVGREAVAQLLERCGFSAAGAGV